MAPKAAPNDRPMNASLIDHARRSRGSPIYGLTRAQANRVAAFVWPLMVESARLGPLD